MIKEAIKHNKVFGLGGPPYNPGATSFDIKQLTKDRFGKELSLKELKELAGENKELGRWSKDVLRKEEKFPDIKNLIVQTAEGDKKFLSLVHAVCHKPAASVGVLFPDLSQSSFQILDVFLHQ